MLQLADLFNFWNVMHQVKNFFQKSSNIIKMRTSIINSKH